MDNRQKLSEQCIGWFQQEHGRLLSYLSTCMPGVEDAELLLTLTSQRVLHAVECGHLSADADTLTRYTMRLLYRAGCNALREQSRRHAREEQYSREQYADGTVPHMLREDTDDTQLAVRRAVLHLPQALRQLIILHLWQELTFSQIASILHLPLSTVKSRYRTAIQRLEQILKTHSDSPS